MIRLVIIISALVFLIDQISKFIVVQYLDLKSSLVLEILPPYLNFRMGWNTGVNFGFMSKYFANSGLVLVVLALVISVCLVWWTYSRQDSYLRVLSVGFIVGGALGNALDRLVYGAVADFINMSCCSIENPFAFNIADIFIFTGVFGLLFTNDNKKV